MKALGRTSSYPRNYDPTQLERVPRSLNREHLDIHNANLPFKGFDVWHIYEVSYLLINGAPQAAIGKLVVPANSEFIVESKSLKLYFNSFNMEKMGECPESARKNLTHTVQNDLEELLECKVEIDFFYAEAATLFELAAVNLDNLAGAIESVDTYSETPELLSCMKHEETEETLYSTLLKSNCRVTNQPDWGDVLISYKADRKLKHEDLLKYIISFRDENHFHEEIVETIYKRLYDLLAPKELIVIAFYTRRGGIDINPVRALNEESIPKEYVDAKILQKGQFRQ